MNKSQLCIRVPEEELKILDRYAKKTKRTKTDIVREFIRSLEDKLVSKLKVDAVSNY